MNSATLFLFFDAFFFNLLLFHSSFSSCFLSTLPYSVLLFFSFFIRHFYPAFDFMSLGELWSSLISFTFKFAGARFHPSPQFYLYELTLHFDIECEDPQCLRWKMKNLQERRLLVVDKCSKHAHGLIPSCNGWQASFWRWERRNEKKIKCDYMMWMKEAEKGKSVRQKAEQK